MKYPQGYSRDYSAEILDFPWCARCHRPLYEIKNEGLPYPVYVCRNCRYMCPAFSKKDSEVCQAHIVEDARGEMVEKNSLAISSREAQRDLPKSAPEVEPPSEREE